MENNINSNLECQLLTCKSIRNIRFTRFLCLILSPATASENQGVTVERLWSVIM